MLADYGRRRRPFDQIADSRIGGVLRRKLPQQAVQVAGTTPRHALPDQEQLDVFDKFERSDVLVDVFTAMENGNPEHR